MTAVKCEFDQCSEMPQADVQWGTASTPCAVYTFCQKHLDEFWEQINPLLQANVAWYRMDAPGKLKEGNHEILQESADVGESVA